MTTRTAGLTWLPRNGDAAIASGGRQKKFRPSPAQRLVTGFVVLHGSLPLID